MRHIGIDAAFNTYGLNCPFRSEAHLLTGPCRANGVNHAGKVGKSSACFTVDDNRRQQLFERFNNTDFRELINHAKFYKYGGFYGRDSF